MRAGKVGVTEAAVGAMGAVDVNNFDLRRQVDLVRPSVTGGTRLLTSPPPLILVPFGVLLRFR